MSNDRRIKVLVLSASLTGGGAERFASNLLNHLDRTRFAPSLCLLESGITYPLAPDVPVVQLEHRGARAVWRTIRRLRKVIEETKPDVVLSNIEYTNIFAGAALRGIKNPPRWVARVGAPPTSGLTGWRKWVVGRWQRFVYPQAHAVVANSQGLARMTADYFPNLAGRVGTTYNPTDLDWVEVRSREAPLVAAPQGVPVLLTVGRLDEQKRPDVLLDAFARVRQKWPAELWICGEGHLRRQIVEQVARLGLEDSVKLLGFCDNPYALMRQASVFVMTSDFEGLPNALIEAQGLGLPAVSTRCPHGPDEILVHDETGLLVPMGNVEAIASALEGLLADPVRRAKLGANARRLAHERFDLRAVLGQWEQQLA